MIDDSIEGLHERCKKVYRWQSQASARNAAVLLEHIDRLQAELARARATIDDYEHAIAWDTTCVNCASLLSQNYNDHVRANRAEAALEEANAVIADLEQKYAHARGPHGWEDIDTLDTHEEHE